MNCETGIRYSIQKWEVELWTHDGDCYSGWCAASWGCCTIKLVNNFVGMTHTPIKELTFELDVDKNSTVQEINDVSNNIFSSDDDGGDSYYPCGSITINMDLFKTINRYKDKRPVWIFYGNSCLGKSYLSHIIENSNYNKSVYETDSSPSLPEEIFADIIVIGNKYPVCIDDIDSKIKLPHELIKVQFQNN